MPGILSYLYKCISIANSLVTRVSLTMLCHDLDVNNGCLHGFNSLLGNKIFQSETFCKYVYTDMFKLFDLTLIFQKPIRSCATEFC